MSSKERLLEAAMVAIEAHGEAGLRVDEIAQAAEVAKPSLYHFYGSRDGLIAAAQAERYRRSLLVGMEQVVEFMKTSPTREQFQELVRTWLRSFTTEESRRRRAIRLEVLGSSVSRPELRAAIGEANDATTAQLTALFEEARARGLGFDDSDLDPADVALWLNGLWNGRYIAEIDGDTSRMDGWDRITTRVLQSLLIIES